MDIVDFLTAQYDEDEAVALRWLGDGYDWRDWQLVGSRKLTYSNGVSEIVTAIDVTNQPSLWAELIHVKSDIDGMSEHLVRHTPAHVLADIAAKRRTLERHRNCGSGVGWCDDGGHSYDGEPGGCPDLCDAAASYADRPGYDPAWAVD